MHRLRGRKFLCSVGVCEVWLRWNEDNGWPLSKLSSLMFTMTLLYLVWQ